MPTILEKIVASTRVEVARAKTALPEAALRDRLAAAPQPRDFLAALAGGPPIRLIAEVKKASPSKGVIRDDFQPVKIAKIYQRHANIMTSRGCPYRCIYCHNILGKKFRARSPESVLSEIIFLHNFSANKLIEGTSLSCIQYISRFL